MISKRVNPVVCNGRGLLLLSSLLLVFLSSLLPLKAQEQREQKNIPNTPINRFMQAIQNADIVQVKRMLNQGLNLSAPNDFGNVSPLVKIFWMVSREDVLPLARQMLRLKANVNGTDEEGNTALMMAAQSQNSEVLRLLLAEGANVALSNNRGETALMAAGGGGTPGIEIVRLLLERGADVNARDKQQGKTVLMHLIRWAEPQTLELLIRAGADVNAADNNGETALMGILDEGSRLSLSRGDSTPIGEQMRLQVLLRAGADINAQDKLDRTVLSQFYDSRGRSKVVKFLLDSGADMDKGALFGKKISPLHFAAYAGDAGRIRELLRANADPTVLDGSNRTPLMRAADANSPACLQLLLDAGAEINSPADNPSALGVAIESHAWEAAEFLLKKRADPNTHGVFSLEQSLLAVAIMEGIGQEEKADRIIALLLDAGANVNPPPGKQYRRDSPLEAALKYRRISSYQPSGYKPRHWAAEFLRRGANVNPETANDFPLLSSVIGYKNQPGDVELARAMIERGADPNGVMGRSDSREGSLSLLHAAAMNEDAGMVNLLLEKGASPHGRDGAGKTPLHWAAFRGNSAMVRELVKHGADLNTIDVMNQTALRLARKGEHPELAAEIEKLGGKLAFTPPLKQNPDGTATVTLPLSLFANAKPNAPTEFTLDTESTPPALVLQQQGKPASDPIRLDPIFYTELIWRDDERNGEMYAGGAGFYAAAHYRVEPFEAAKGTVTCTVQWGGKYDAKFYPLVTFRFRIRRVGENLEFTVLSRTMEKKRQEE